MLKPEPLNLFYEEPESDRWIKYDRYPRKLIRRIIRGKQAPGGVMMIALQLMKGLDRLNIPYRFNDYAYVKKNSDALIGVIGKPHLIFEKKFQNPILFGAGVFSHPIEEPLLFEKYPNVKHMLVPGEWMVEMCKPYYGNLVSAWPAGIDTNKWAPQVNIEKPIVDFLIYDKIRWDRDVFIPNLYIPISNILNSQGLTFETIRYGFYKTEELAAKLSTCKAVIFLCEHETQGFAYQQILSSDTPILAWDRGGFWQDPYYFPDKVKFQPVSSVPYWDDRCGIKFKAVEDFESSLKLFNILYNENKFAPRNYILDHLTLEKCARQYYDIYNSILK